MKRCTRCGQEKPLTEFPPVRRGGARLQSWCRACFADANAANYAKDRDRERARRVDRVNARRAEVRALLIGYLREHPCVDCGESDVVVLEFDHLHDKIADVTTFANGGRTWARVLTEIDKCEVRCANCHRRKTAERRSGEVRENTAAIDDTGDRSPGEPLQMLLDSLVDLRTCRVCHTARPMSEFPYRSMKAQTRQWICKPCQRTYAKEWYARNRAGHMSNVARNRSRSRVSVRRAVRRYLADHPCVDCGETDVRVLEFDHVRDKTAEISALVSVGARWALIEAEIAKCEVRCANCHRRKTVKAISGYRAA